MTDLSTKYMGIELRNPLIAGAKAVQVTSALYKYGIENVKKMIGELKSWMDKHNFSSIDQFRGKMSQSKSDNPAAFERVQFMKYFRGYKPDLTYPEYIVVS